MVKALPSIFHALGDDSCKCLRTTVKTTEMDWHLVASCFTVKFTDWVYLESFRTYNVRYDHVILSVITSISEINNLNAGKKIRYITSLARPVLILLSARIPPQYLLSAAKSSF